MKTVDIVGIRKYNYSRITGRPTKLTGTIVDINRRKRHAARKRVKYYLKTGRLQRLACDYYDCASLQTEAHHANYNFPLDVLWLCSEHHLELHKNL